VLDATSNLSKILDTLKKREEFTDDEIDMVDNDIHSMSKVWIGMFGREGMMNYFHLLTNGHAIYFLRKWRSLYRYSNQGWEDQNKRIWSRYYHHTNHGGSNGTNGGRGSKIKPIGLWYLRIMHWLSVDKTAIQRIKICYKEYDSDRSNVDVMEDDDISFSMDGYLVEWERASPTKTKVFFPVRV
jgi:hypothetical protein